MGRFWLIARRRSVGVAVRLLAMAFGFAMSAGVVHAAKTDIGTTTVKFNIAEAIEVVSWPAPEFTLSTTAVPGVPVVSGWLYVSVKSNASWGLQISSDDEEGRLREYDPGMGAYVMLGRRTSPLEWAADLSGPWSHVSSTPTTMFTNQPPTGEDGATVGFLLRVVPSFDDEPLPPGREYRIVLTYTAGVGF